MWNFCCIWLSLGLYEWALVVITKGKVLRPIEDFFEFTSLGISDWPSEGIKEGTLLGFKDSNK